MQHALRRGQHLHAFGRQPGIGARTLDDHHAVLLLQCADGIGQRRLRDVAGLRGTAEVAVFVERDQVAQGRQDIHGAIYSAQVRKPVKPSSRSASA